MTGPGSGDAGLSWLQKRKGSVERYVRGGGNEFCRRLSMVMLQQVSCGDDQELDDTMRNVLDRLRGLL